MWATHVFDLYSCKLNIERREKQKFIMYLLCVKHANTVILLYLFYEL